MYVFYIEHEKRDNVTSMYVCIAYYVLYKIKEKSLNNNHFLNLHYVFFFFIYK